MSKRIRRVGGAVYAFADGLAYANSIARELDMAVCLIQVHRFPDRETLVRVPAEAPRRAILIRSLADPNEKLIEVILAADAIRRAGAHRVALVAPYLPYMRQDKVFAPGEPVSQRVIAKLLGESFDAVFTMEPHLHRIRTLSEVFPCRAINVPAAPALTAFVRMIGRGTLVAGPDEESGRWVRAIARAAGAAATVGRKQRIGDRDVRVHFGKIKLVRRAIVIDDIASSGATLAAAVRELRAHGIERIEAVVVHAIFAPGAMGLIRRAGACRIVSCDTVVHPTNAIQTARYFAGALGKWR